MEKIIEMERLKLYKEASEILTDNKIGFNKASLLEDPELCQDIINIFNYFHE